MLNEVKHLGVKMEILRFAQDDVHMLSNQFIWLKGIAACKGRFLSNLTSDSRSLVSRMTGFQLSMTRFPRRHAERSEASRREDGDPSLRSG